MKLLSRINLEETDLPKEEYFRDEALEVEGKINGRKALIYFDVEVVVYSKCNYIDGLVESVHKEEEMVYVEFDSGYFTDDGDVIVVTDKEINELEKKVEKLIKLEL